MIWKASTFFSILAFPYLFFLLLEGADNYRVSDGEM